MASKKLPCSALEPPGLTEGNPDNNVDGIVTTSASKPSVVIVPPPNAENQVAVDIAGSMLPSHSKQIHIDNNDQNSAASANNARRNPLRKVRREMHHLCQLCDERDTNDMVQCAECNWWFHLKCVQITRDFATVNWTCRSCKAPYMLADKQQRQIAPPDTLSKLPKSRSLKSKASSTSEARKLIELEMRKLEEEFQMEKRFIEKKYELLREYASETSSIAEDNEERENLSKIEEWLAETCDHGEAIDSGLVAEGTSEQTPITPGKHKEHRIPRAPQSLSAHQRCQRDQSSFPTSVPVMQNQPSQPCFVNSQHSRIQFEDYPRQPLDLQSCCHQRPSISAPRNVEFYHQPRETREELRGAHFQSIRQAPLSYPEAPMRSTFDPSMNPILPNSINNFAPRQRSTPTRMTQQISDPPAIDDETICILSRSQIAARQAIPRDLPEFDGALEDWPLFYATFNSSTQMCGLTNEENMLRLRKCLKGKALEAVRSELLHPSNVADILSTLKMLYGRPEAIVQSIVRKIKNLPPPNTENLETVVNFALTVKNMIATIRACEVTDFIFNASLRYELVERLPSSLKLDWARFSRNHPSPNLADFSAWLYSVAEDASTVMASGHEQKNRGKKDGFLNYHSESDSSTETPIQANLETVKPSIQCLVCKGKCMAVTKCARFEEFSVDSRWATVERRNTDLVGSVAVRKSIPVRYQSGTGVKRADTGRIILRFSESGLSAADEAKTFFVTDVKCQFNGITVHLGSACRLSRGNRHGPAVNVFVPDERMDGETRSEETPSTISG
ncbi:uncharacterized protein LOC134288888 [Aedes albopictus]|uniref:PHD-type domain-containing protein n=1 Tax=Aedes albopictus TaxID=7160 RepID=A0ABM1ZA71_AEDAL